MRSLCPLLPLLFGAAAARDVLLFTLYSNHSLMRAELDGSGGVVVASSQPEVLFPDGQQVDEVNKKVYWSNMGSCCCEPPVGNKTVNPAQNPCHYKGGSIYRADWPSGDNIIPIVLAGTAIGAAKELHLDVERQQLYCGDKNPAYDLGWTSIWRIDLAHGPPFTPIPMLQQKQLSASGVTLDHTGEKLMVTSDGEGQPPGVGVMGREIPAGYSAANRTDLVWHYKTECCDHIDADSSGKIYWTDSGACLGKEGLGSPAVRVGSADGVTPARTIQTRKAVVPGPGDHAVGIAVSKDEREVYYTSAGSSCFRPTTPAGPQNPNGKIFRSSVEGGAQEVVWQGDHVCIDGVAIVGLE